MPFDTNLLAELKASGYTGDILFPPLKGTADEKENDVWDLATRSWGCQAKKNPQVVFKPGRVEDVSKALIWLSKHHGEVDFAVRSGGVGQSQSDDVIMDLGHFDKFDYDASSETVTLGPGQTWRTVYEKLISTPVTVMGGRVGYVGVGGFLTGGGLCFLTNMYGLASNNVIDYQIVLADGRVLWASEDPELAQAMRGAGYSFGVVTEIVMKALPKPPRVYAGYLLYAADKLEALAKHVEKLTTENTDPRISLILSLFHAPGFGPICCMSPFIAGIEGEDVAEYAKRPEVFGWAWDYAPINDNSKVLTFEEAAFINENAIHRPDSTTSWQIGGTMLSSFGPSVFTAGASWVADLQSRTDGERFNGAGIFYMPFMKNAFNTTSATKGVWPPPGVTTLNAVSVMMSQPGSLPGHPEENATLMREGVKAVEEAAQREGINVVKKYPNYLIKGSEPTDFYDEETLDLLRKLKRKYDPSDMFNKGIRIGL